MKRTPRTTPPEDRHTAPASRPHPDLPDPETYVSEISTETFVGFATVDDFADDDDCALCAMEREAVRNGALVELHDFRRGGFDEDDFDDDEFINGPGEK